MVPSVGQGKAMVAIAGQRLVVVWHVLTHQVVDRPLDRPLVTRQRRRWGAAHGLATSAGVSRGAVAQQVLERLGLGGPETAIASAGASPSGCWLRNSGNAFPSCHHSGQERCACARRRGGAEARTTPGWVGHQGTPGRRLALDQREGLGEPPSLSPTVSASSPTTPLLTSNNIGVGSKSWLSQRDTTCVVTPTVCAAMLLPLQP